MTAFWDVECERYDEFKRHAQLRGGDHAAIVVLREGPLTLGPKTVVPVMLISNALRGARDEWPLHPALLSGSEGNVELDAFMTTSPLSSSPREVRSESESEVEDNVASRVDRIHGAMRKPLGAIPSGSAAAPSSSSSSSAAAAAPKVAAPQGSLDWIFEVGAASKNAPSAAPLASALVQAPVAPLKSPSDRQRAKNDKAEAERAERAKREQHKVAFFDKMKQRKAADLVQGIKAFVAQFSDNPPQGSGQ